MLAAVGLGGGCSHAKRAMRALSLCSDHSFHLLRPLFRLVCNKLMGCVWRTQAADDAANGLGSTLLTEIPVGGALTSAALFIDLSSMQVRAGPAFPLL